MASNPLNPAAVLDAMANALPTHEKDDTTSDMSSSLDCVALFVHACMINLGFRLLGFNEDQKIGAQPSTPCSSTESNRSQKPNAPASRPVCRPNGTSP
jgi:hypothetical protein